MEPLAFVTLAVVGLLGSASMYGFGFGSIGDLADAIEAWWADADAHDVLEVLGAVASFLGFVMPRLTTINEIRQAGSIGQRSSIPYSAALLNCVLWVVYGYSPRGNSLIVVTNIIGAAFMLYYVIKFLQYSEAGQGERILFLPLSGLFLMSGLYALYFSDMETYLPALCWLCAGSRGLVGLVPLMKLGVVFTDGNMLSMPSFPSSGIALLNGALWAAFVWTGPQWDGFIFWPNMVGAISSLLQVLLHIIL